jgi:hypothetical protein
MAWVLVAVLSVLAFCLYQLNADLRWWVKHYRREVHSRSAFISQLLDHLSEADRLVMGLPRLPREARPKLNDDDWPDHINS